DLGGAYERALLAVQELRDLPGLEMVADAGAFGRRQPVPHVGAEDRHHFVGQPVRVLGIDRLRPVDPLGGVPLQPLALLMEAEELVAPVRVLPAEDRLEVLRDVPLRAGERLGVAVERRHVVGLLVGWSGRMSRASNGTIAAADRPRSTGDAILWTVG